jgi:aspartyl-tRNA(Asn)/glutamyl-tRNA(Gln) amidotransferase subunit B
MVKNPVKPRDYAVEHDLIQKNDPEALKNLAQKLIDENPEVVASYKSGKENAIMSLVGKIMKESGGSANPQVAKEVLVELLK